jgi:hypothetical protein
VGAPAGILTITLFLSWPAASSAQLMTPADLPAEAVRLIEELMAEKARRTPAQMKVSSSLLREWRVQRGTAVAAELSLRRTVDVADDGTVMVDISGTATPEVLARISEASGTVVSVQPEYRAIRARLPLDAVEAIAGLKDVQFIRPAAERPPSIPVPQDVAALKINTSEGDVAHHAAQARALYGVTGAGVRIGVLAGGARPQTLMEKLASGDLPMVTVPGSQHGTGDDGTAMLEIVHDLAPGAELLFATAAGGEAQFAANITALCNAGARIIVDDGSYDTESVFQDGIVAQAVNAATASGCVYFSAVANAGNKNDNTSSVWEGDFVSAGNPPSGTKGGTIHSFGIATSTQITADTPGRFTLQWSDPRAQSTNDYDLYLFNPGFNIVFAQSDDPQNGSQDPFESIDSAGIEDVNNRLVVVKFFGADRYLHLSANGGRLSISTEGQIAGHAAAKNAIAVGAVNVSRAAGGGFTGGASNPIATSSSDGPRRIFYQPDGTAITPGNFSSTGGEVVQKPDIVAADCVSTSTAEFLTFCDTAAAAAHAAAIAALMLEAVPSLTRSALVAAMKDRALDIEAPGTDRDSGAGIVDAIGAVGRTHPPFIDSPLAAGITIVKAAHISQLRNRVNALRIRCGLPESTFSDPSLMPGMSAQAVHIAELRTALNGAYQACGVSAPTYMDSTLAAGSTVVKAAHIAELQSAVLALE